VNPAVTLSLAQVEPGGTNTELIGLILILFLIVLLIQKELSSTLSGRYKKLSQALNIAIVPLFLAFLLIVALKLIILFR
jgi:hypothetical protein